MSQMLVTVWNNQGFLPAVMPDEEEFLNYRKNLHEFGLVKGIQWLDGSFV